MTENEDRLNDLFDKYVPDSGAAESMAGELVRATARIGYRYFNDGDKLGIGYGRQTCNPAGRFLGKNGNDAIADILTAMWGCSSDEKYEQYIDKLSGAVVEYVESDPSLADKPGYDMFEDRNPEEDVDDDDDEEEYYEDDYDEEEEDEPEDGDDEW